MNVELANILKSKIEPLPFADRVSGLVTVLSTREQKEGGQSITKKYPIASNLNHKDCLAGRYNDLVPNSNLKSIIYFEDGGIRAMDLGIRDYNFESRLRLVGWLNMAKLGKANTHNTLSGAAIGSILSVLPKSSFNEGSFTRIKVTFESEEPKSSRIFNEYTYDESVIQYLLYPYDYFAINLKITFNINMNCLTPFLTEPEK
jgi:hypothetical protein